MIMKVTTERNMLEPLKNSIRRLMIDDDKIDISGSMGQPFIIEWGIERSDN